MIKLPFRWKLFVQFVRTPYFIEEYWGNTFEKTSTVLEMLHEKYHDQPNIHIRTQYFIESNQDRICVFKYKEGE